MADGVALACVEQTPAGARLCWLEALAGPPEQQGALLCACVERRQAAGLPTVLLLARGSYNLIQTERPEVPDNELSEALRWQLRDLFDFPAEQAIIEAVTFDQAAAGQPLTFAVAASSARLRPLVAQVRDQAGLDLRVIDIPELVLRELLRDEQSSQRGVALLCLWPGSGLVLVSRAGELCMARRFNIGLDELTALAEPVTDGIEISAAQQEMLDALVLEVQRSLDYYESHITRQPVSRVLVAPLRQPLPGLIDYLNSYLTPETLFIPLQSYLADLPEDEALCAFGFTALAAALRALRETS
ncbi:hypothetical protein [Desulfuromonas thiophila]|uniref:MSHA biogenesis protein MshI n=1 Tax=Desulfuromonas thiophila TaxID=57664 RepID=A0A1G6ZLY9_9BACT|nr:hypothetical protein [Desulfuromonas thiophila]SDE02815.1 MSHA biogenesis protein MshI [Desulfuromonas thiophila]